MAEAERAGLAAPEVPAVPAASMTTLPMAEPVAPAERAAPEELVAPA